jgi:hypothetical protein
VQMMFKPAEVGWRLGRAYEPAVVGCGCRGTAPPASSAHRGAAKLLICSLALLDLIPRMLPPDHKEYRHEELDGE